MRWRECSPSKSRFAQNLWATAIRNCCVDSENTFFAVGLTLRGHEFHYSGILPGAELPSAACGVLRGVGCGEGRDGIVVGNLWASYTHLHALATPEWAAGLLHAARRFTRHEVAAA